MFSKTVQYAIKAMIFLAKKSNEDNKIGVKEIADAIDAPQHFVGKILQELSRKGMIQSTKGPNGGFYLLKVDLDTTISQIVLTFDNNKIYTQCVLGLKACSASKPCPVHFEYKNIRASIIKMIETNTIGNFYDAIDFDDFYLKV